jgi:hypothetical protein
MLLGSQSDTRTVVEAANSVRCYHGNQFLESSIDGYPGSITHRLSVFMIALIQAFKSS